MTKLKKFLLKGMIFFGLCKPIAMIAVLILSFFPTISLSNINDIVIKTRQVKQLFLEGKYEGALETNSALLSLLKTKFGNEHFIYGFQLAFQGEIFSALNDLANAEIFLIEAEYIVEKSLGNKALRLSDIKNRLGSLYHAQSRYLEAEAYFLEAIEIDKETLTSKNSGKAVALSLLAGIYITKSNFDAAEKLLAQALENITIVGELEKLLALSTVMNLRLETENYSDAIKTSNDIRAILDRNYSDDPRISEFRIIWLINEAMLNFQLGNYDKAEELNEAAIRENLKLGDDGFYTNIIYNNLAVLYSGQGRNLEAERFVEQSLLFSEKVYGKDRPSSINGLLTLTSLKIEQGAFQEAIQPAIKALDIAENFFGPGHPYVATAINNLAYINSSLGNFSLAKDMYLQSTNLLRGLYGDKNSNVALQYNNLGFVSIELENYDEAYYYFNNALKVYDELFSEPNPNKIMIASNLSYLAKVTGDEVNQLKFAKLAFDLLQERSSIPFYNELGFASEQRVNSDYYKQYIGALAANFDLNNTSEFTTAFSTAQMSDYDPTASAIEQTSKWLGKSDDEVSKVYKKRQGLIEKVKILDRRYNSLIRLNAQKKTSKKIKSILRDQAAFYTEIKELEAKLSSSKYFGLDLIKPRIINALELQSLLKKDEAVVKYVSDYDKLHVFVITNSNNLCLTLNVPAHELSEMVAELRLGLSLESGGTRKPFNAYKSHVLYNDIFEPIQEFLKNIQHIFLVPDGALESIPFTTLVTEEPNDIYYNLGDAINLSWLAEDYSISILPNVSVLPTLRAKIGATKASRSFLGVGDPVLSKHTSSERGITFVEHDDDKQEVNTINIVGLPSLPETRDELDEIANSLGRDSSLILVGEDASEKNIKNLKLSDFRVVAFATHGLLAGDIIGVSQPGLLLTPPAIGSKENNGILTASEIAELEFDAEWIILSACNTAAPDGTPGAENLSGLARAFFFAGARRLFVSHWKVETFAAKKITTQMFDYLKSNWSMGRAQAHQKSIMTMINSNDVFTRHPAIWGAFTVVGDT